MNAAIYARKSNEQKGRAEETKSVTRQIENALAYAAQKGWTVEPQHIFKDDGVSGAEFEKRPGLQQALTATGFSYLIVSERKSLGREMWGVGEVIRRFLKKNVEIWTYKDRCLTSKNHLEKGMDAFEGVSDEGHFRQTQERVTESHTSLHAKGYVTGNRIFGYRNKDIITGTDAHGRPIRSHVDREIIPEERAVVIRIFEMYAAGYEPKAIVGVLNAEGAVAPKPFIRKDPTKVKPVEGWSTGAVRRILKRETYRGHLVWNRSKKRNELGEVQQRKRPKEDVKVTVREDLAFINADLWRRVEIRLKEQESHYLRINSGRLCGRPPKHGAKNLLAGLATCSVCGGGLVVETSARKNGRIAEYVCFRRRHSGRCSNGMRMPVDNLNEAILRAIEEHALTPEAIESVLLLSEREDVRDQQSILEHEREENAKKIARLVQLIETGSDALVARLKELEQRQRTITAELTELRPIPRLPKAVVTDRLSEWRRALRASISQSRGVIQQIVRGRITFTPIDEGGFVGYQFSAPTRFDRLFSGLTLASMPQWMATGPIGTEHIAPHDTPEVEWNALLANRSWKSCPVDLGTYHKR